MANHRPPKLIRFFGNTLICREAQNPNIRPKGYHIGRGKQMKIHLNPILKFWIEAERESRRKWLPESKVEAMAQILSEWEAFGGYLSARQRARRNS
jgi:hypothetical protein